MSIEAMKLALEALGEIALAGMSGTGQESDEAMTEWHARQAWKFIGIAARQLDSLRQAIAEAEQAQPVAIALNTGTKQGVKWLQNVEHGMNLYTAQPKREPLTNYELEKMRHLIDWTAGWSYVEFARAIEAKHGIKE